MKRKSFALILLLTLISVTTDVYSATTTLEWYTCTVIKAGPGGNKQVLITLADTGGAFTEQKFAAAKGREKEMLAVALAAIANNMQVHVSINSRVNPPIIYDIYLVKP